jgi:hypothetical protein
MRKGFIFWVLMLSSCSFGTSRLTATPPPTIGREEYAVYSALIQENPTGYILGAAFVVREQTVADLNEFERTLENVHRLPSSLVDSYRSRNAASYSLSVELDIKQDYVLMSQEDFDEVFRQDGPVWERFETKYPGKSGMIIFSRVGFDVKGNTALASMGYRCGDLCGAGGLYILVKEDGNWKVQEALMVWQS